jgi:hypothetical protein
MRGMYGRNADCIVVPTAVGFTVSESNMSLMQLVILALAAFGALWLVKRFR